MRLISLFPFVRLNLVMPILNLKMIIGCSSNLFDFGGLISNYHGLHWSFLFNLEGVWGPWVMVPLLCYAIVVFLLHQSDLKIGSLGNCFMLKNYYILQHFLLNLESIIFWNKMDFPFLIGNDNSIWMFQNHPSLLMNWWHP